MLPQTPHPPPFFFIRGGRRRTSSCRRTPFGIFFASTPSQMFLSEFYFYLTPPTPWGATGRPTFCFPGFFNNFFREPRYFRPVVGAHFFCQRTFVEFFSWGGGLFQHLKRYFYIYPLIFIELTPKKRLSGLQRAIK